MTSQQAKEELKIKVNELRIKYEEEQEKLNEARKEIYKNEDIIKKIENEERLNEAFNCNIKDKYFKYLLEKIEKYSLSLIDTKLDNYNDKFIENFKNGFLKKSNGKFEKYIEAHNKIISFINTNLEEGKYYKQTIHYLTEKIFKDHTISFDDKDDNFKKMKSIVENKLTKSKFDFCINDYYKNSYNFVNYYNTYLS